MKIEEAKKYHGKIVKVKFKKDEKMIKHFVVGVLISFKHKTKKTNVISITVAAEVPTYCIGSKLYIEIDSKDIEYIEILGDLK